MNKRLILLLLLSGCLGATGLAQSFATFACQSNTTAPAKVVRGTGEAELVADHVITCTGGNPSAPPVLLTFTVALSTTVTNKIIDTSTNTLDSLLLLNDPAPASQTLGVNMFRGVLASAASMTFSNIPVTQPGSAGTFVIRITNVRVNAVPVPATSPIAEVVTAVPALASSTSYVKNVATIQSGSTFDVRTCDDSGPSNLTFLAGNFQNPQLAANQSTAGNFRFNLRFTEGFITSFRNRLASGQDPSTPGTVYPSESGFVNTQVLGTATGFATQGTRLFARFSGVPAGVRLFVTTNPVAGVSTTSLGATLVSADSNGDGTANPISASGTGTCGLTGTTAPIAEVALVNGVGTATWEVSSNDPAAIEKASFGVVVAYNAPPAAGTANATGELAPLSTVGTASATASVPRFADTATPMPIFTIQAVTSAITTTSPLPSATVNVPYSTQFQANFPATFSIFNPSQAPPGLTMNSGGLFSGTPTQAGTYSFTVQATPISTLNVVTPAFGTFTITVNPPLQLTDTSPLPNGVVGQSYGKQLGVSGGVGPYTFTNPGGGLPPGLSLSSSGLISGAPTTAGNFPFSIQVNSSDSQVAVGSFSIKVNAALQLTDTSPLPNGTLGQSYSKQLGVTGGVGPYTFTNPNGGLPPGLSVNSSGLIGGTPSKLGTYPFSIQVNSTDDQVTSKNFSITINDVLTITNASPLLTGTVGVPYSVTFTAAGGTSPYTFSLVSFSGPFTPMVASNGTLTTTATAAGAFDLVVQVRDAQGLNTQKTFRVNFNAPLAFTTANPLPNGQVGAPYSVTLALTGGTAPYSIILTSGTLPAGLTFSNGTIQGTPASAGSATLTFSAADSTTSVNFGPLNATQTYNLTIVPLITISPATLADAQQGSSYSASLSASGGTGPYSFSIISGSLPAGLTLSSAGAITGTPTSGAASFTVQAADSKGATGIRSYTIGVRIPNTTVTITTTLIPNGTVGTPYTPTTLNATGGNGSFTWSGSGLPPGLTISAGGVISGTPTLAGTYHVIVQVTDGTNGAGTTYDVTISAGPLQITSVTLGNGITNQPYGASVQAIGGKLPYSFSISDGALPDGLSLATSGAITGTPTTGGAFSFTVQVLDGAGAKASKGFTISITATNPMITTGDLGAATVGIAYSQTLSAIGGTKPYTFSVSGSLPDGLSINGATGEISGIPTAPGSFSFTAQVADKNNLTGNKGFTILVNPAPLLITSASPLADITAGTAASLSFAATGGVTPYTFAITGGSLPAGLSLNSATGAVTGTTAATGPFSFTLEVTDAKGAKATKDFSGRVVAALVITLNLPAGTVGQAYTGSSSASGGIPPYRFSIGGNLPPGLSFDPATGAISGTPTAPGNSQLTITVTDSRNVAANAGGALSIGLPVLSTVSIGGVPNNPGPNQQPKITVSLGSAYPVDINGTVTLSFQPDAAVPVDDPSIQFITGGRTASFTIPKGTTQAAFPGPDLGLQTGTVAGTITLTTTLQAGGVAVNCNCALTKTILIPRSAPVIVSVKATRSNTGFTVTVIAFSPSRELTQASFQFSGAANLQTTTATVPLGPTAATWYQSAASAPFGSQFALTLPFTITGDNNAVTSVSVTISNANGASTAVTVPIT